MKWHGPKTPLSRQHHCETTAELMSLAHSLAIIGTLQWPCRPVKSGRKIIFFTSLSNCCRQKTWTLLCEKPRGPSTKVSTKICLTSHLAGTPS